MRPNSNPTRTKLQPVRDHQWTVSCVRARRKFTSSVAISAASFCDACYLIEVGVPGAMAVMDQLEAFPIWNSIRVKEVGGSKKEYTSQGALRAYGRYDELQLFGSGSEAIRGEPVISERPVGLELVKKFTQFSPMPEFCIFLQFRKFFRGVRD